MAWLRNNAVWLVMIVYVAIGATWIITGYPWPSAETSASRPSFLLATWRDWLLLALGGAMIMILAAWGMSRMNLQKQQLQSDLEQRRDKEAQSKAILDHAADAIISADEYGVIHLFNPAAARIFGYMENEVLGKNIKMLIPRPYLPEHESYRTGSAAVASVAALAGVGREVSGRRKDGTRFPLELAVSEIKREPHRLFIAVARDITERKQSEAALERSRQQLRSLAARLQAVREEERTRISREIHDVLGQALTGVKMDLSWIKANLPESKPDLRERAGMMSDLVDTTIQTVRKIATELRPGILDNLGLVAALEWQAEEFQNRTGIACQCTSRVDEDLLGPSHQTALFRIFQETLTNVARHAQATRVEASLRAEDENIWLRIQDNGRGITPQELTGATSLGLLGIRERAAMLGGEVHIVGRSGGGTTVTTRVPAGQTQATPQTS
jgi:PAS domain S-box-containing protein